MTTAQRHEIRPIHPAGDRLGVMFAGLGAVATTTIAGIAISRRMEVPVIGSIVDSQQIRIGTGLNRRYVWPRDILSFSSMDSLVFGAWDPIADNGLQAASRAGVLSPADIELAADVLQAVEPIPAVFSPNWVRRLGKEASNVKEDCARGVVANVLIAQLMDDIQRFKAEHKLDRVVVVWTGSTEASIGNPYTGYEDATFDNLLETFRHPLGALPPSMLYAIAAIRTGCPFYNASPNYALDYRGVVSMAQDCGVPIAGKDLKTGQTLMKTVLAPMLKARSLGLNGWFSTNILGNRDGQVLDDPDAFHTKEESKLGVLASILDKQLYPELYGNAFHKVRIEYYPPRGDEKEGWDNIDIFGWLGYKMQIKVNFLCRDSILAAPLVYDLIMLMDLAQRAGLAGTQDWLSFFFKSPMPSNGGGPVEHDLFIQHRKLKNRLRMFAGYEPLTHAEEE